MNENIKKFLGDDDTKLDLGYIFSHLRNIGISAIVVISGLYLKSGDYSGNGLLFLSPVLAGYIILIVGFFLIVLNSVHFSLVLVNIAAKVKSQLLIGVIVFFILLWVNYLAIYIFLAQVRSFNFGA